MNAHKFVAEHGIQEAKRVLEGAPEHCVAFDMKEEKHVEYENTSIAMAFLRNRFMCMDELKQVVKSLDTIDRLFGLDQAKRTMKIAKEIGYTSDYEQIKQAISDYELVESFKKSTLVEYLDECEQVVNSWPKWKKESMQNAFGFGGKNEKCEVLDMVDVSPRCEVINETH